MAYIPASISTFGFACAPVSRFWLVSSIASSTVVGLLHRSYQSVENIDMFNLNLDHVFNECQVWRLFTSMFVVDGSLRLICKCILIYNFVVIERRLGSSKYLSFIFSNWLVSLGIYGLIYKLGFLDQYVQMMNIAPPGMYGAIFGLLIYYYKNVSTDERSGILGLLLSRKSFVYMIALQMMFDDKRSIVMSLCGTVSGLLYYHNLLRIQNWLKIPNCFTNLCQYFSSYIYLNDSNKLSQKTYMGATAEIHEDILFDHISRRQQETLNQTNHNGSVQMGQGYADVINPSFGQLFNSSAPVYPPQSINDIQHQPSEENIQILVDMGFSRDAVHNALRSTGNDLQQATTILLSATAQT